MERVSAVPDTVVIGQDDQTEVHVQPMTQSGRRHVDVRVWRRGPGGFAPSRTGLALEASGLVSLSRGISDLLERSEGGHRVARGVWDEREGRRLRAEIEPFGTRYVARLGFWQRVRNSWRPADDGLLVAADRLGELQDALQRFLPWLEAAERERATWRELAASRETLRRWPSVGGDWLTIEPDRVALHPRGARVTGKVTLRGDTHVIEVRQWHREDTLWLPEAEAFSLTMIDLDAILIELGRLTERQEAGEAEVEVRVPCSDGSFLRIRLVAAGATFHVEQAPAQAPSGFRPALTLPAEYLPRVGRMLAECWSFLFASLSAEEREELRSLPEYSWELEGMEAEEALAINGDAPAHDVSGSEESVVVEVFTEAPAAAPEEPLPAEPLPRTVPEPAPPDRHEPVSQEQPLGIVDVGKHVVAFSALGQTQPVFSLRSHGCAISVPFEQVDAMLLAARSIYYDALRGRRSTIVTSWEPALVLTVRSEDGQPVLALSQGPEDGQVSLAVPMRQVPAFLDAAQEARRQWERG